MKPDLRNDAMRDQRRTTPREPTFGEWVKIEDGCVMPEVGDTVLAFADGHKFTVALQRDVWLYYGGRVPLAWVDAQDSEGLAYRLDEVSHYTPLPPDP